MGTGQLCVGENPWRRCMKVKRLKFFSYHDAGIGFLVEALRERQPAASSAVEVDLFAEAVNAGNGMRLSASLKPIRVSFSLIAELPRNIRQDHENDEEMLEPLPGMYVEAEIRGKAGPSPLSCHARHWGLKKK